jgi:hypothetical protein
MTETDFITDGNLPKQDEQDIISFNKDGKEVSNENEIVFAKIILQDKTDYYYVRMQEDGMICDPLKARIRSKRTDIVKMKKVTKDIFDFYMMYLNTKNNIYIVRAQRGFING